MANHHRIHADTPEHVTPVIGGHVKTAADGTQWVSFGGDYWFPVIDPVERRGTIVLSDEEAPLGSNYAGLLIVLERMGGWSATLHDTGRKHAQDIHW